MSFKNAIELHNVTKSYDGFTLDNVSFNVPKGSVCGFIGQNGAGKTTTINAILNIIPINSGNIKILGYLGSDERDTTIGHFFHAEIINGEPMLGGIEYEKNNPDNFYEIRKVI